MLVRLVLIFAPALAAGWLVTLPASAQTERSGGGEAQRFMQQYQQIASEKSALQTQLAQQKKELDAAQTELAAVKKERDTLKAHAGATSAEAQKIAQEKDSAEKSLEQYKQRMNEIVLRFREMAGTLKGVEADRAKLRQSVEERNSAYDRCVDANVQLAALNEEILNRYEHVGFFTKVSAAEPFTRITRARIENLVDEYRARAEQLKLQKSPPSTAVPPSGTGASPAPGASGARPSAPAAGGPGQDRPGTTSPP